MLKPFAYGMLGAIVGGVVILVLLHLWADHKLVDAAREANQLAAMRAMQQNSQPAQAPRVQTPTQP